MRRVLLVKRNASIDKREKWGWNVSEWHVGEERAIINSEGEKKSWKRAERSAFIKRRKEGEREIERGRKTERSAVINYSQRWISAADRWLRDTGKYLKRGGERRSLHPKIMKTEERKIDWKREGWWRNKQLWRKMRLEEREETSCMQNTEETKSWDLYSVNPRLHESRIMLRFHIIRIIHPIISLEGHDFAPANHLDE